MHNNRAAAGARYRAAVIELREAFTELAAWDQLLRAPSFGPAPEVVPLRHPEFADDIVGSFTDGIRATVERFR
jgi:hypothetical protein